MWSSFKQKQSSRKDLQMQVHLPISAAVIVYPLDGGQGPPPPCRIPGRITFTAPPDYGDRLYRGSRLVLRSVSTLNLGPGRESETDVFAEETVMNDVGPPPNYPEAWKKNNFHVLDRRHKRNGGMWTAEFPISVAASDDTVPGAEIRHYIFNQYIGQDPDPTVREPHLSTTELEKHNYNIPFPANPGIPRLNHSVTAIREVHVVHSPFTPAETNTLDDLSRSAVSGLGVLELHCTSNAFTVAGPLSLKISFPCPSHETTIFSVTALVEETQTLKSPRDWFEKTSAKTVAFLSMGSIPQDAGPRPGHEIPNMWRGVGAGGKDEEPFTVHVHGRFPHSCDTRASTLPGMTSPVTVKHAISYHVLFSVEGQDSGGKPISGPGELRRLKVTRQVTFPSCHLAHIKAELPSYTGDVSTYPFVERMSRAELSRYYVDTICPSCHRHWLDMICTDCGPQLIPHTFHEPEWRENMDWKSKCDACAYQMPIPKGDPDHVSIGYCACIDWMKWKMSPRGAAQITAVAVAEQAGMNIGKQIELDETLATKLDTEERLRQAAKVAEH